ncbi:MAG: sulfatase [Persicimonas sp.]
MLSSFSKLYAPFAPTKVDSGGRLAALAAISLTGGITGAVLGLVDAMYTGILGFFPVGDDLVAFFAISVLMVGGFGAIAGLLLAAYLWLFARWSEWSQARWRSLAGARAALAVIFAVCAAALVAIYGLKVGPKIGVPIIGGGGIFNPVTPGLVGLMVLSAASLPLVGYLAGRKGAGPVTHGSLWVICVMGLLFRVFDFVLPISNIFPSDLIHLACMLGFVWLGLVASGSLVARLVRIAKRQSTAWVVAAVVAVGQVFFVAYFVDVRAQDALRLTFYERTVLVSRILDYTPDGEREAAGLDDHVSSSCEAEPYARGAELGADFEPDNDVRGVVFIFVDALRADHVGAARDGTPLAPNLERLAEESWHFRRAYTACPSTHPSLSAMMTGYLTEEIVSSESTKVFWMEKGAEGIFEGVPDAANLTRQLHESGVYLAGAQTHPSVDPGFERFDTIDSRVADAGNFKDVLTSEPTYDATVEVLEDIPDDKRFFLFTHFFDPHAEYISNPMFDFGGSSEDLYDAEVAYTDHWIGRLLEVLDERGLADETAVVVVGDHGEEFYEHRYTHHGFRLYDESTRVPLMIRLPGGDGSRRVDAPVSTADAAPTLAKLLGVDFERQGMGASLLREETESLDQRPIFSTTGRKNAVVYDNHKLIYNDERDLFQFYDLREDPDELHNVADERGERFEHMVCLLDRWLETKGE